MFPNVSCLFKDTSLLSKFNLNVLQISVLQTVIFAYHIHLIHRYLIFTTSIHTSLRNYFSLHKYRMYMHSDPQLTMVVASAIIVLAWLYFSDALQPS